MQGSSLQPEENAIFHRSLGNTQGARLGAHPVAGGVSFAVYSGAASRVELCLFDTGGSEDRHLMTRDSDGVWHCFVPGARVGQLYGLRAYGPYAPLEGQRFNPAKLLLDPYARAFTHLVPADALLLGHDAKNPLAPDMRDSAPAMPKCVVADEAFEWGSDLPPRTPWDRTVIYECHVKGLTKLHPQVPAQLRGAYLGLACPAVIDHLCSLGITAVELLPVHCFVDESRLVRMGLVNYWGYNSIGYFAPDLRYATRPELAIAEFRMMVRALHQAGIEVILDVVYNHTAEGDERGPTLSFRGLDNRAYYHLVPGRLSEYANHSACGNTLNVLHPRTQQLIMDSLRYWVEDMHVDGFRFDLAPALSREPSGIDEYLRFYTMVLQDPVLSQVKLMVEPWDAGPDGFCLGRFPQGVREWNGKYRDCVRRFWRGDEGQLAEFVSRLAGSSDIFWARTTPLSGVNYVTCHDGSTLSDLVSYAAKHNEPNGEENRDGPPDNFSSNYGVEGPALDVELLAFRERMKRNLLATLAFSQGVPMLTAGDELGRTQLGNDNAYCQDNEISWLNWNLSEPEVELLEFTKRVLAVRRNHVALRRDAFFDGRVESGVPDVVWLDENGREISVTQWHNPARRCFAVLISNVLDGLDGHAGNAAREPSESVNHPPGSLLLLVNADLENRIFRLPVGLPWQEVVNTATSQHTAAMVEGEKIVIGKSLILLDAAG